MPRAVLDTNVIVSGFIRPQGPPGILLDKLVREQAFELILSAAMLAELHRAAHYPKVRALIALSDEELDLRLAMLDTLSIPVEPKTIPRATRDPDDDLVLAAAMEGRAEYVVTGDNDLLTLGRHEEIRIVTPTQFLEYLNSS